MAKVIQPSFIEELRRNREHFDRFIQVILGPRQVGKTTGLLQFLEQQKGSSLYFSADDELATQASWLTERWQEAVLESSSCLLVIDEIQKIPNWSQTIKNLWDRQKREKKTRIKLILLGSSSLELQTGLSESLTGRFQLIQATHWGYEKSKELHRMDVDEFIRFGGYPGSYALLKQPLQWEKYIKDSIVETVIGKDILQTANVQKPALFRQAFVILMSYPAQDISYTKLLGQLQDSGNTDLIKRYIDLYEGAFLLKAVHKYSRKAHLSRASSPKLVPLCGALIDRDAFRSKEGLGRAFEAAVGAALINAGLEVAYWKESQAEIDYVVEAQGRLFAIEVKSGRVRSNKGMARFLELYPKAVSIYVTPANVEKLLIDPRGFLEKLAH
ncbi:MAG: ATP-binding protein [Bdellovibrionaceae bacterium]|nr:ATP-binding protein [Pseudobdellovibrionaceae bacterium]